MTVWVEQWTRNCTSKNKETTPAHACSFASWVENCKYNQSPCVEAAVPGERVRSHLLSPVKFMDKHSVRCKIPTSLASMVMRHWELQQFSQDWASLSSTPRSRRPSQILPQNVTDPRVNLQSTNAVESCGECTDWPASDLQSCCWLRQSSPWRAFKFLAFLDLCTCYTCRSVALVYGVLGPLLLACAHIQVSCKSVTAHPTQAKALRH